MSVQLEILPQEYLGFLNDMSPLPTEQLADAQLWGDDINQSNVIFDPFNFNNNTNQVTVNATALGYPNNPNSVPFVQQFTNDIGNALNASASTLNLWLPGKWFRGRADVSGSQNIGPFRETGTFGSGLAGQNLVAVAGRTDSQTSNVVPAKYCFGYKMGGLTIGNSYEVKILVERAEGVGTKTTPSLGLFISSPSTQTGFLDAGNSPNGLQGIFEPLDTVNTYTQHTMTFVATTQYDILWIYFQNDAALDDKVVRIRSASVKGIIGTDLNEFSSGDGSVVCDLYEEENIPLSLSIDDFKKVTEKVQSYSKAFKLPATKRNSKIFDNIFEVTRTAQDGYSFNPYVKTRCRLKEDGFVLFEGYLRLIDIQDKGGEISYNINLYSEAVALADVLADRTFDNIDFSELDHIYNLTNITDSWTGGLELVLPLEAGSFAGNENDTTTDVLKYPFCDWNHQFIPHDDNGGADEGQPELLNLQSAFRPFIKVKYLIDKIISATPFQITSNFFDSIDFNKLYMDFNWGDDSSPSTATDTGEATYSTSTGEVGAFVAGDPVNYATTAFTNIKFYNDSFTPEMGWDTTNHQFEIPSGLTGVSMDLNATVRFACKKDCDITFEWFVHPIGSGGQTYTINTQTLSVTGAAAGFPILGTVLVSSGVASTIAYKVANAVVFEGGFYSNTPLVKTNPDGNLSTLNVTSFSSNAVNTVTVSSSNNGYNPYDNTHELVFKGPGASFFSSAHSTYSTSTGTIQLTSGDKVGLRWKATESNAVRQRDMGYFHNLDNEMRDLPSTLSATINYIGTVGNNRLNTIRGELEQWAFLKGIFNMFNLVTVPDKSNPNNILIEPYKDIFVDNDDIQTHDWTDKVDGFEKKLTPLTDLKQKTIFKYEEDEDDYAFNVYKKASGTKFLYGSRLFDASGFTILENDTEEIVAEPFAATVIKPLMSQYAPLVVPNIYAYNESDNVSESFENLPRILYDNGIAQLQGLKIHIPAQNAVIATELTEYLQFSHLSSIPTQVSTPPSAGDTRDFNFGPLELIPLGNVSPNNNLFATYWQPYFGELYNPDTRSMTIKVSLNASDINTFNMYDKVFIKNREFRVNKIDYKPGDLSTVEFILIP